MNTINKTQRSVLLAANISYILVILDSSIVNVALPSIRNELSIGTDALQWIVNAYLVVFASLLLSGGALCDRIGPKTIYISGLLLFVAASLMCGLSVGATPLLVGRGLQGIGAALLVPSSLALITHSYPDHSSRAKAIASWASWGGIALVMGPLMGGLLTQYLSWRSIFLINIPIGLVGVWLTSRIETPAYPDHKKHFDLKGQFTVALMLLSLIWTLIEYPNASVASEFIVLGGLICVASLMAFVLIESRTAHPMLPLMLFKNRNFSSIAYIFLAGAFSFFGTLFVLTFYFQDYLHYSAVETGLALLPLSLCVIVGNKMSGRLVDRFQPRQLMIAGALIRLVGFCAMLIPQYSTAYSWLLVPLVLIGLGGGLGAPMSTAVFMQSAPKIYTGIASGLSRATGQIGSALGVAVFGHYINDAAFFLAHMKLAVLMIVIATLSIVIVSILFVGDRQSEHGTLADPEKAK
ncbi:MFS transporter [Pseudomonas fluorescens]|uniref:MFS transporter n=1 Tax=Pseudomonas fluorescens TaxID=294 RepID=UPI001130F628|nr:MFS transporter [Pseudomonas fluorescens]TMU81182.1 MFS transporter [Pseudomonas fluorescens]